MGSVYWDEDHQYNRFTVLDGLEWKLVDHLLNSTTKAAENIWKILYYPTVNCLNEANLTRAQKLGLIYTDNGESVNFRVFISPFADDAWKEQCAHIHIYTERIIPEDRGIAKVNICVESIVHAKVASILSEADEETSTTDPGDLNDDGSVLVIYKNRATVLLKYLLSEFNGLYLGGVGYLQFNRQLNSFIGSNQSVWNNRSYYGHTTTFGMMVGNDSDDGESY